MFYILKRSAINIASLFRWMNFRKNLLFLPYYWMVLFFLFPCIILFKISFAEPILASPPYTQIIEFLSNSVMQIRINLSNYIMLFQDQMYIDGFLTSVSIASISTIGCLMIGFPMSYAIARSSPKVRSILLMLVILPFWTSFLIRVYACIVLLSPAGIINNILHTLHLIDSPLPLMYNTFATCLGIIYSYLPFMIFPLYAAIEKIDFSIIEAAYDLGSTPFKTFFSIIIPLSVHGILAGACLVFVPAIGELVIPELLGGPETITIGRLVWNEFFTNLSWPTASAISILLLIFVIFPLAWWQNYREVKLIGNDDSRSNDQ